MSTAPRRLFAATLLEAGVAPEVVSAIVGHSSIGVTANIYAKVRSDLKRRALSASQADRVDTIAGVAVWEGAPCTSLWRLRRWGRVRAMAAPRSDLTSGPSTGQLRWERISEAEARAAIGDEALDAALAEVGAKGRASAERYRAAGHSIADQA
ncbi:MAG: hypothetical protein R2761_14310 [Acidimicrobiales bacterium]